MALTIDPSLRKSQRKKTGRLALGTETEEDIAGRRKTFLGDIGGLEERATEQALALDFDPSKERAARTGFVDLQTQQARERLGRQFGISPESIQSGRALRGFGTLEAQRLGELSGLERELSIRAGQEQRANLAAVQGLMGQRGQQNLAAAQGQLSALGQSEAQLNALEQLQIQQQQQALAKTLGTGELALRQQLGTGDLALRQQLGLGSLALEQELGRGGLALGGRAQTEAEIAGAAQRGIAGRAQSEAEMAGAAQRVVAGRAMAEAAAAGAAQRGIATRAMSEAEAAGAAQRGIAAKAMTEEEAAGAAQRGIAGRAMTLQEETTRRQLDLAQSELFGEGETEQVGGDADLEAAYRGAFQSSVGDANYVQGLDIDGDGTITFQDFIAGVQAGSPLSLGNGQYRVPTPGRKTLGQQQMEIDAGNAAKALNIDETRVKNAASIAFAGIEEQVREFNSNFLGVIQTDPDFLRMQGTGPDARRSPQAKLAARQLDQIDQAMTTEFPEFLGMVGLTPYEFDQLDEPSKVQIGTFFASIIFGPSISFGGGASGPRGGGGGGSNLLGSILGMVGEIGGAAIGKWG